MDISRLINKLAQEEKRLTETPFLSPCVAGSRVRARVGGLVQTFQVEPRDFEGWGVFLATSAKVAELYEEASLPLIERYFKGLKPLKVRLIGQGQNGTWLAYPVNESDMMQKLGVVRPVRVNLVESGKRFETVTARCDGRNFWFEEMDRRSDPKIAEQLGEAFGSLTLPEDVKFADLTPEMRTTLDIAAQNSDEYKTRYADRYARVIANPNAETRPDWQEHSEERRLRDALATGGGTLQAHTDHGTHWTVEWTDRRGVRQTSAIDKRDLTVISSGVCLSGQDRDFDLQSLVGVMEGWGEW